ncbi:hypothetical protein ES705_39267 [subsurface metagenome]
MSYWRLLLRKPITIYEISNMKYPYWLFLIFFLFTSCERNDPADPVDICSGFEDKVYNYSIYSCTEADSLDCSQKVLESVLLPDQYLKCSSTDSLTRTCLMYPFLGNIWLYNSIQQGFDHIMNMFNGFDELFTRENANIELIKVYQEINPEGVYDFSELADQGAYMTQLTFIEITIAQFQLINKLTAEETETLIEVCLDKYYDKSEIPSYSWLGEMSVLAIMARILYSQNYKPFMDELMSISGLNNFIEWASFMGLINIEEITQFIISNAENYLQELKK